MNSNNESQKAMRDIDLIIEGVRQRFPHLITDQLKVTHPADDDGLWFFNLPENPQDEIQLESPDGNCPFLIEYKRNDERKNGERVEQIIDIVCEYFRGNS